MPSPSQGPRRRARLRSQPRASSSRRPTARPAWSAAWRRWRRGSAARRAGRAARAGRRRPGRGAQPRRRRAAADVLVFVDSDVEVHPDALARIERALRRRPRPGRRLRRLRRRSRRPRPHLPLPQPPPPPRPRRRRRRGGDLLGGAGRGPARGLRGGRADSTPTASPSRASRTSSSGCGCAGAARGSSSTRRSAAATSRLGPRGPWSRTDFGRRGVPWARLLLREGGDSTALNLGWRRRASAAPVVALLGSLLAAPPAPGRGGAARQPRPRPRPLRPARPPRRPEAAARRDRPAPAAPAHRRRLGAGRLVLHAARSAREAGDRRLRPDRRARLRAGGARRGGRDDRRASPIPTPPGCSSASSSGSAKRRGGRGLRQRRRAAASRADRPARRRRPRRPPPRPGRRSRRGRRPLPGREAAGTGPRHAPNSWRRWTHSPSSPSTAASSRAPSCATAIPAEGWLELDLELRFRRDAWGAHESHDEALLDAGIHLIDLACHLTQSAPIAVGRRGSRPSAPPSSWS